MEGSMSNGPIEPSAENREMASNLRQTYIALTLAGFTPHQALIIIGHILWAGSQQ
jgi:hypothetical protein